MMTLDNVLIKFKTNMADQRMDMFVHSPAEGEGEQYEEMSSSIFLPTAEHHVSLAYRKYFSLSEELNANA